MGQVTKYANAAAVIAVVFSFAMYTAAFEPFGVAELAYVFAVPAILACRFLCGKTDSFAPNENRRPRLEELKKFGLPMAQFENAETKNCDLPPLGNRTSNGLKIWLVSAFASSFLSWIAILAWLRHVYPPAGYVSVVVLPMIISSLFIFPWYAMLPRMLPSLKESQFSRLLKLFGAASLWVILEWMRSWLFSGFPWGLLAHSQWTRPASIQTAEIGGVWIVSFVLIFFNLAAADYIYRLYETHLWKIKNNFSGKPPFGKFAPEFYIALCLAMASVWMYISNMPKPQNRETAFCAGLVQTDFAGILKWNDALASENLKTIKRLSEGLKKSAAVDVLLWPEAATPPRWPVVGSPEMKNWIESLSKEIDTPILMGNMAYNFSDSTAQNGAFYVSPKSGLAEKFYAKRRLVPFGEHVPRVFKWIGKIVPSGNMKAGDAPILLNAEIKGRKYKIGAMICYEDIFPALGRELAKEGADILFVCTNDSWYGREGGAWQHAAHSAFQAVATRLPLMRSSNNGLSTVFDQYGNMRPAFDLRDSNNATWDASTPFPVNALKISDEHGNQLDAATLKAKRSAPLLNSDNSIYFRGAGYADVVFYKNFKKGDTIYVRYGDWFVALCCVIFSFMTVRQLKNRRRH